MSVSLPLNRRLILCCVPQILARHGDALSFFETVRAQAVQAGQTVGDELSKGVNWSKLQEDIANIPAELARVPAELAREARQEPSLLSQSRGFKEFKSLYQLQSVSLDPESEGALRAVIPE